MGAVGVQQSTVAVFKLLLGELAESWRLRALRDVSAHC